MNITQIYTNIINRGLMKQLQVLLSTITRLTGTIRQQQAQNGYSQQQIDEYLIKLLSDNLHYHQQSRQLKLQNFISQILLNSTHRQQLLLLKIIQILQLQSCCLTRSDCDITYYQSHSVDDDFMQNPQHIQNNIRKITVIGHNKIVQLDLQQQLNHYYETYNNNYALEDKHLVLKTPQYKYKNIKQKLKQKQKQWAYNYHNDQTNKQYDFIEKSIQQTLDRTRKLKKYLSDKIRSEKMAKFRFENGVGQMEEVVDY